MWGSASSAWIANFLSLGAGKGERSAGRILSRSYSALKILPFGSAPTQWNPNGFHTIVTIIFLSSIAYLSCSGGSEPRRNRICSWFAAKQNQYSSREIINCQLWCLIRQRSRNNWVERVTRWTLWASVESWGTEWRCVTTNPIKFVKCR
jgi:hypothetical protein